MKYTLLSLFTFAILESAIGQSFSIINPVNIVNGTTADLGPNGELVAEWHVQNTSDSNKSVRANRNVISSVAGSINYFCWGVCFDENTNISPLSVSQQMGPGEVNTTFYAHYKPQGNAGETVIQYCFFDQNNPSDAACQTVRYCVDMECLVSQKEIESELELSELSPNPLKGLGTISYQFKNQPQQAKFVVRNMVGQIVKETNIQGKNGILIVDGADFTAGIYLYSIVADGKTLTTKRMLVQ